MSDKTIDAIERIYEVAKTPNWDGDGADALTSATRDHAITFARLIPDEYGEPDVFALVGGEAVIEWYLSSDRLLSVLFNEKPQLYYASLIDGKSAHGRIPTPAAFPPELAAILDRLVENRKPADRKST